ncbi:MAG: TldD/PmbA family protein [Clostridia bacterium]|nr:TldD/PmbA family protein [Clostridia bacterium]
MYFENAKDILVREALAAGLDEYEIYYTGSSQISTETLKDEISSFSGGSGSGISFRCIVDGHMGVAATELFEENELRSLVRRAIDNATVIENDDLAIIFGGSEKYSKTDSAEFEMPETAYIKELALGVQAKTYAESDLVTDGTQSGVFAEINRFELVNSKGLRLSNTVGLGGVFVQAVINRDGEAQEAFDFSLGFDKAEALSATAVKEAISKLGAEDVPSGKYRIIIDGKQMRSMLSAFSSVFSGKNALLGLSLLKGKEGERIAADCVTLCDDPMKEGSPVQTPFDGEGVATYKKNVIENGILKTLLYDLSVAHKAGVATTGNGQRGSYAQQVNIAPFTFYIKGGELTETQLLERMGDGIYVTELKGLHAGANAVTGDFSIESAGYLVENGKKTKAVKGFTIAGNFFDLLKGIEAVADNVKFGLPSGFTTFGSPDLLLGQMSVAGV